MTQLTLFRLMSRVSVVCVIALVLVGCGRAGDAAPVLKIGLIAPFEGLGRPLGYAVLPAVQDALAAANASGALGPYRLLLVALNDDLDPAVAAAQAAVLAQDPDIIAVIGPFTSDAAATVTPILANAAIPAVIPSPLAEGALGSLSLCPPPDVILSRLQEVSSSTRNDSCSQCAMNRMILSGNNPRMTRPLSELVQTRGAERFVFWPGGAAEAAQFLLARRAEGWTGVLVGGPDVLKPWFVSRAGATAEGTRAVACVVAGAEPAGDELPEVVLARAATKLVVDAIGATVSAGQTPTRAGVGTALAAQTITPELVWYEVTGGAWQAVLNR